MELEVHHYFHEVPSLGQNDKLDHILHQLHQLGDKMTVLSDAVDAALASEADEDTRNAAAIDALNVIVADLQAQLAAAAVQVADALANDAADAQTIADTQAALNAQAADNQVQIDRLAEAFPSLVVPPPVEG